MGLWLNVVKTNTLKMFVLFSSKTRIKLYRYAIGSARVQWSVLIKPKTKTRKFNIIILCKKNDQRRASEKGSHEIMENYFKQNTFIV